MFITRRWACECLAPFRIRPSAGGPLPAHVRPPRQDSPRDSPPARATPPPRASALPARVSSPLCASAPHCVRQLPTVCVSSPSCA